MNEPTCLTKPIRTPPLLTLEHSRDRTRRRYSGKNKEGTNQRSRRDWRGSSEESTARDAQRTGKQHRSQRARRILGRTAAEQWDGSRSRARSSASEGMQWESIGVEIGRSK